MEQKIILVTGATDGIGKQVAYDLALMGHKVIVHGKRKNTGHKIVDFIKKETGNEQIFYYNADISNFKDIKQLAEEIKKDFPHLDVLLNNAGVFMNEKVILPNGLEKTFMVNHIAVFCLTNLLLEHIKKSKEGRIIVTSSMAQSSSIDFNNLNGEKYWDPYTAYAVSKLENVLFTYKLNRRLISERSKVSVNCLHPGVISTKLLHAGWGIGGASLKQGAETSVFLAVSEQVKNISGKYFVNKKAQKSVTFSYDTKAQDKLWQISNNICIQNIS
jgi:NAD(P)-dependent dehydrogenase (short-subunit alcohol dehydrogenase family)